MAEDDKKQASSLEERFAWLTAFYRADLDDMTNAQRLVWVQQMHAEHGYERLQFAEADPAIATDNPYWELIQWLPVVKGYAWQTLASTLEISSALRRQLVKQYSWSIPSPMDLKFLREILYDRSVVEIGAGAGYWAWQLAQAGIDVVAFDLDPRGSVWHSLPEGGELWFPVEQAPSAVSSHYPDRVLMMVWPPYNNSMAVDGLRAYQGDMLIYVGEPEGGCTGDEDFHELLDNEWEVLETSPGHYTYEGIHCYVFVYRRKG